VSRVSYELIFWTLPINAYHLALGTEFEGITRHPTAQAFLEMNRLVNLSSTPFSDIYVKGLLAPRNLTALSCTDTLHLVRPVTT
jgi:hypothetical protein